MRYTNILISMALLAIGANAAPGYRPEKPHHHERPEKPEKPERPERPDHPVYQNIQCSSGAPYCCSTDKTKGSNCSKLEGSSISCNSVVVCCNNNGNKGHDDTEQKCSGTIQGPISWD